MNSILNGTTLSARDQPLIGAVNLPDVLRRSRWPDLDTHSCLAHQSVVISTDGRPTSGSPTPERLRGPHFAINLKAAKSVSMCRRIFASVHESAFVPCLPSRAPVVYGSYQGISCRQRRLSTAAEDDPKRPFALARLLVGRRRHQISKALLIAIGSDFDLLAMLR